MEIRTGTLDPAQLEKEIGYFVSFFSARSVESVQVAFGWGCRLMLDELWIWQPVPVSSLSAFISENRNRDRFYLGQSDLLIAGPGELRLILCHESDIHFDGDPASVAEVSAHWRGRGFTVEEL